MSHLPLLTHPLLNLCPCTGLPCVQVLAPTDEAFDALLRNLGGGRRLPLDQLLALPELPDILAYHIIPGRYLSGEWLGGCHTGATTVVY